MSNKLYPRLMTSRVEYVQCIESLRLNHQAVRCVAHTNVIDLFAKCEHVEIIYNYIYRKTVT